MNFLWKSLLVLRKKSSEFLKKIFYWLLKKSLTDFLKNLYSLSRRNQSIHSTVRFSRNLIKFSSSLACKMKRVESGWCVTCTRHHQNTVHIRITCQLNSVEIPRSFSDQRNLTQLSSGSIDMCSQLVTDKSNVNASASTHAICRQKSNSGSQKQTIEKSFKRQLLFNYQKQLK